MFCPIVFFLLRQSVSVCRGVEFLEHCNSNDIALHYWSRHCFLGIIIIIAGVHVFE